ncbi:hypothetical protein KGF56_000970 [Candida oxycetoniae]|uniref:Uncharacterized protein n=1 Tax=Candida oxycetoniae TaxID=497107 RepID=A0AAI9WZE9_9ASCO|nr:uncharacterized protein KGF56_000970 [Candida oxycetoniae]KAI3406128.2 hypothetical protein KGF56_000970 [Candida oxycetoniae]
MSSHLNTKKCSLAIESPTEDFPINNPLNAFLVYNNSNSNTSNRSSRERIPSYIESNAPPFSRKSSASTVTSSTRGIESLTTPIPSPVGYNSFGEFGLHKQYVSKPYPYLTKSASVPNMLKGRYEQHEQHESSIARDFHPGLRRISICDLNNFSEEVNLFRHFSSMSQEDLGGTGAFNQHHPHAKSLSYMYDKSVERDSDIPSLNPFNKMPQSAEQKRQWNEEHHRNHRRRNSIALKFEEPRSL